MRRPVCWWRRTDPLRQPGRIQIRKRRLRRELDHMNPDGPAEVVRPRRRGHRRDSHPDHGRNRGRHDDPPAHHLSPLKLDRPRSYVTSSTRCWRRRLDSWGQSKSLGAPQLAGDVSDRTTCLLAPSDDARTGLPLAHDLAAAPTPDGRAGIEPATGNTWLRSVPCPGTKGVGSGGGWWRACGAAKDAHADRPAPVSVVPVCGRGAACGVRERRGEHDVNPSDDVLVSDLADIRRVGFAFHAAQRRARWPASSSGDAPF